MSPPDRSKGELPPGERVAQRREESLATEGWDCHAHIFGPYGRYPLAAERSYTPPEASQEAYQALLARLDLGHGVLVHPSAYGANHELLMSALARHDNLRGVIVTTQQERRSFRGLREQGVRGARFSHRSGAGGNFAGSASLEDLKALAPAIADAGLHAELWTDCASLPAIADVLRNLPIPVVIDHMGGFRPEAGVNDTGFRTLTELLASGHAWVKLCLYRNFLPGEVDPIAGQAFHDALVAANPEQVVWGSDWPHLRVEPEPDTARLLSLCRSWLGPQRERSVLVDNPARLYG